MVSFDPAGLAGAARAIAVGADSPQTTGRVLRFSSPGTIAENLGAFSIAVGPASLSRAEVACAAFVHSSLSSLLQRLARAEKACATRALRKLTVTGLAECLDAASADAERTAAGLARRAQRSCSTSASVLGVSDIQVALDAARDASRRLRDALFGSLSDRLAEALPDAGARACASRLVGIATACGASLAREFAGCVKRGLFGKDAPPGAVLPFAFTADLASCIAHDPRSRVQKACSEDVVKKAFPKCSPGSLSELLPGCNTAGVEPATCVPARARCALCQSLPRTRAAT